MKWTKRFEDEDSFVAEADGLCISMKLFDRKYDQYGQRQWRVTLSAPPHGDVTVRSTIYESAGHGEEVDPNKMTEPVLGFLRRYIDSQICTLQNKIMVWEDRKRSLLAVLAQCEQ